MTVFVIHCVNKSFEHWLVCLRLPNEATNPHPILTDDKVFEDIFSLVTYYARDSDRCIRGH